MAEGSSSGRDIADTMAEVGASRWWFGVYGVLSVLAGVVAIAWPGVTLFALAVLFAVQLFVLGVFRIVAAFAVPDTSAGMRVIAIVGGVLSVIVGVICLRSPFQTVIVLTLVLGAFWLVNGIMEIVAGIAAKGEHGRMWSIVGGLIGVLGGVVVLSAPIGSAVTLAWLLGVLLVAHGIVAIISGFARSSGTAANTGAADAAGAQQRGHDSTHDPVSSRAARTGSG